MNGQDDLRGIVLLSCPWTDEAEDVLSELDESEFTVDRDKDIIRVRSEAVGNVTALTHLRMALAEIEEAIDDAMLDVVEIRCHATRGSSGVSGGD